MVIVKYLPEFLLGGCVVVGRNRKKGEHLGVELEPGFCVKNVLAPGLKVGNSGPEGGTGVNGYGLLQKEVAVMGGGGPF